MLGVVTVKLGLSECGSVVTVLEHESLSDKGGLFYQNNDASSTKKLINLFNFCFSEITLLLTLKLI